MNLFSKTNFTNYTKSTYPDIQLVCTPKILPNLWYENQFSLVFTIVLRKTEEEENW